MAVNSLDMLHEENGRRYVKHYFIDFGSTLGSASARPNSPRSGNYLFSWREVAARTFTFGLNLPGWARAKYPHFASVTVLSGRPLTHLPGDRARIPRGVGALRQSRSTGFPHLRRPRAATARRNHQRPPGAFLVARLFGDDAEKDIRVYLRRDAAGWQVTGIERGWVGKSKLRFADTHPPHVTQQEKHTGRATAE